MIRGVQPTDGGHYIFSDQERNDFIDREPSAEKFFRPFIGSREHINGLSRWILFLEEAEPEELRAMPLVVERIRRVRAMRLASRKAATVRLAARPTQLEGRSIPTVPFLVVPKVSSEQREYVPIGWLEPPTIPSDLVFAFQNATLSDFALLTSAMHMAWLRHVGGRLKSDYRYSIGLVYNTFPHTARRRRPVKAGTAGPSRTRRPRHPPHRNPGRPVRPRPDAAQFAQGPHHP